MIDGCDVLCYVLWGVEGYVVGTVRFGLRFCENAMKGLNLFDNV